MKKIIGVILAVAFVATFGVASTNAAIGSQLGVGSRGSQVSEVQQFLATNSFVYPAGLVTGYYGSLTQAAVKQFQLAYNILPTGTVNSATLVKFNAVEASGLGFDISAPIIFTPSVQVSNNTATISWSTNESARGKVVYGINPVIIGNTADTTGVNFAEPTIVSGSLAPYDGVMRTAQNVTISNLSPNTTYYYMIEALDASGNLSVTWQASFHTNQ